LVPKVARDNKVKKCVQCIIATKGKYRMSEGRTADERRTSRSSYPQYLPSLPIVVMLVSKVVGITK
jgi:hypothetical protein